MGRGRPKKVKEETSNNSAIREINKATGANLHYASAEKAKERVMFPDYLEPLNKLTGGIPLGGSYTIIWGVKGSCKTTFTYILTALLQKEGKRVVFFDLEHSFDGEYASKFGVQLDKLLIGEGETAETVMDTIIKMNEQKLIDFAIVDSIQGMSPKGEQETKKGKEKSIEDDEMGLLARKMSKFFRVSTHEAYKANVGIILIGQTRKNLNSFAKLDTLSGGEALGFWATMILKTFRGTKKEAPTYKFKVNDETKTISIGFNLGICLEKKKISNCAPEGTVIYLPFYNEFGFVKPTNEQIEEIYGNWIEFEKETDNEEEEKNEE